MSILINIYAASGCGKSTGAAALYAAMKDPTIAELFGVKDSTTHSVELVREVAKAFAWQGIKIDNEIQSTITQRQCYQEDILFHNVDFIITDCPVLIGGFYAEKIGNSDVTYNMLERNAKLLDEGHIIYNYLFTRHKPFVAEGRYETEEQAIVNDKKMRHYLDKLDIAYTVIDVPDKDRPKAILNHIKGVSSEV